MKEDRAQLGKAQYPNLTKHFLWRFFDGEAIASFHTDMHLLFVQIIGILVVPGLFKTFSSIYKYSQLAWCPVVHRDQAVLSDMHFFLCLSMILTGLVTVLEWDMLFPDRKDFHNLIPLPIRPKIIFMAKVTALLLFIVLCNAAINGLPVLLFPGIVLTTSTAQGSAGMSIEAFEGIKYTACQAASLFLSSLFVFTSLIAVRAALFANLTPKLARTASRCVQLFLICTLFCALLTFPLIRPEDLIREGNGIVHLLPHFWFLGLFEFLIGRETRIVTSLAETAGIAVAVSCFISIIGYAIGYRASMYKGFQPESTADYSGSGISKIGTSILDRVLLKESVERAYFHFIVQTLLRRKEHMLYWGSFVAAGVATIYLSLYAMRSDLLPDLLEHLNVIMSFPLIVSFFILVGLRFVFSVPADLDANWIFLTTDKRRLERANRGMYKFMLLAAHVPLLIIFPPFYLMIWDPLLVFLHIVYVSVLSLVLLELLLVRFAKLPFTCSYLPGKANIKLYGGLYVLGAIVYSYGMTALERWMLADVKRYAVIIIMFGVIIYKLNRIRNSFLKNESAIRFEEKPADSLNILALE